MPFGNAGARNLNRTVSALRLKAALTPLLLLTSLLITFHSPTLIIMGIALKASKTNKIACA